MTHTPFHRRTIIALYAAALVVLLGIVGVSLLTATTDGTSSASGSGIKFSHKLHAGDNAIACADCHTKVNDSAVSSDNLRPDHTSCESCHQEQLEKTCTFCHVGDDPLAYAAKKTPVRELVFSHKFHVGEQKAECATCHAGIETSEQPVGEHVPTMATCTTCHDNAKASNACERCHTNLASLRPREHNRTDFMKEHAKVAQKLDANCGTCHAEESCQECHNGSDLVRVNLAGRDRQTLHMPRLFAISRGQGMTLLKVHDANFRMTHGLAAKGKAQECQTCHDQQEFCSTCHFSGGNANQDVFKPANHGLPGFVTLGVGTGGGAHATLAKRDIETCASCHDAAGADPTCATCHTDHDGIKGTNPRTHVRGFMADEHGDWHTDPGANCYVCHTDPNARPGGLRGQKFCGYCHG